jgi:hypothetical protein
LHDITLENTLSFEQRAEKSERDNNEKQDGSQVRGDFLE